MSPLAKATAAVGCTLLALPLLAALIIAALLGSLLPGNGAAAAPSTRALADIPPRMLALYQQAAATCPGLPWPVLAAIGKVETDHGRNPTMVSSAGAVGPMQFEPATFAAYAQPVPAGGASPPTPWDPVDAVHAAARLLCANGARGGADLHRAIYAYNHDNSYVNQVLHIARGYAAAAPAPSNAAAAAVAYAHDQLGTPYVWGGDGPRDGGFDCSGLTQAAYQTAGIHLPRTAQAQFDAGPRLPAGAPLVPGDLVFFGPDPSHITHVGIYTDGGRMIDAPHPGAFVREEPANPHGLTYQGATRPAPQTAPAS